MAKRNAIETLTQRIAQLTQRIAEKPKTKAELAREIAHRILSNHTKPQPKPYDDQSSLADAEKIIENDWKRLQFSLNKPVIQLERCLERALAWLQRAALLEILALLGNLGLILAVLTYFGTEKQRRDAEVYNAWQTITSAHGQKGNGGRIRALEFLNRSPGAHWRRRTFPFCWETKDSWEVEASREAAMSLEAIAIPEVKTVRRGICWLWPQESLQGLDVAGAHLVGVELPGAYLVEAKLAGATLEGANLAGAYLVEVKLTGATLEGANLAGAYLREAKLTEAELVHANLTGSHLRDANLEGAELVRANLTGATLEGANLAGAELWDANLTRAKLWDANLTGASLGGGANLEKANLRGANLKRASLGESYGGETIFPGANLKGANLEGANLEGAIWPDGKRCLNQDCSGRRTLTEQERKDIEEWFGD